MLTQRLIRVEGRQTTLVITAGSVDEAELLGLAEELGLRSTVNTEGTIHHLNDPAGNYQGTPNAPIIE
jgi:hypothetical protein